MRNECTPARSRTRNRWLSYILLFIFCFLFGGFIKFQQAAHFITSVLQFCCVVCLPVYASLNEWCGWKVCHTVVLFSSYSYKRKTVCMNAYFKLMLFLSFTTKLVFGVFYLNSDCEKIEKIITCTNWYIHKYLTIFCTINTILQVSSP